MNKCLKILVFTKKSDSNISNIIQKMAKKYKLEGSAQSNENSIKITACGKKNEMDEFIDKIYKELQAFDISNDDIEIEPFIKDKDYRGVFRIIE